MHYLGYAERVDGKYQRTQRGKSIANEHNTSSRNIQIIKDIIEHPTFKYALDLYIKSDYKFTAETRMMIIKNIFDNAYNVGSMVTAERRYSTVKQWIKWIYSLIK